MLKPIPQTGVTECSSKHRCFSPPHNQGVTVRNMSPATQRSYVSAVWNFSRYFGKSPERLSLEDVRAFQVHLVSTGISWPGLNQIVCALRRFYGVTLSKADVPSASPMRVSHANCRSC